MDKKIKQHLDDTMNMVDKANKAFRKFDEEKQRRIERREYYCWLCGCMQSMDDPCAHRTDK